MPCSACWQVIRSASAPWSSAINGRDNRTFGPVPLGDVLGEVRYLFCPVDHWDRMGSLTD